MDINELKKLLKNSPTILIIEGNSPEAVIMSYNSYKNMLEEKEVIIKPDLSAHRSDVQADRAVPEEREESQIEPEILEKLNREIMMLKEQIASEEKDVLAEAEDIDFSE